MKNFHFGSRLVKRRFLRPPLVLDRAAVPVELFAKRTSTKQPEPGNGESQGLVTRPCGHSLCLVGSWGGSNMAE